MTKEIDWGDGSGNKLVLTYPTGSGNQQVSVTSDPNSTGKARSKVVTISTTLGGTATATLSVSQKARTLVEKTITLYPSAFVSGQYASISGQTNPVGKGSTSTSYSTINLKTGSRAETWAFYKFDTSEIPADAEIVSVACSAKCYISNTTSSRIATRQIQLYSGTATAKGSASTVSTSTTALNMTCGTWTAAELQNIHIRMYAARGTSYTTTTYYFRFYGATLTIKYRA